MSDSKREFRRVVSATTAVAVATLGAACGSSFGTSDCKETHTCVVNGGSSGAGGGDRLAESGAGASDAPGGGDGLGTAGGDATSGGERGVELACENDLDCADGDAENGAETCLRGQCLPGDAPPKVVSITPDRDATDVEPDAAVVIEFNEELNAQTVDASSFQLLENGEPVPAEVTYAHKKVTLTPSTRLALLGVYEVSVAPGVKNAAGVALLGKVGSKFSVRDGAWHSVDAVSAHVNDFDETLQITADGRVLLGWFGKEPECFVHAQWFLRGEAQGHPAKFPDGGCFSYLSSQTNNAAGDAALFWRLSSGYVQQYRAGSWLAKAATIDNKGLSSTSLAMSPTGILTRFEAASPRGLSAWRTDAAGAAAPKADVLSTQYEISNQARVVFDSSGNGLAVWRAIKYDGGTQHARIVASSYNAASNEWYPAEDVPGSVSVVEVTGGTVEDKLGNPAVAFSSDGDAMVLWVERPDGQTALMSNLYEKKTGWATAAQVNGDTYVALHGDRPALTFDGSHFVAGWGDSVAFTATYEGPSGWSDPVTHDPKRGSGFPIMPQLASDGRGNLMLVWRSDTAPSYTLNFRRFANGSWTAIKALPGGVINNNTLEATDSFPLSMNEKGMAAVAWGDYGQGSLTAIRLASFH